MATRGRPDRVANTSCRKLLLVERADLRQIEYCRNYPFRKYRFPEATAHSNAAGANFADKTSAPTISIPFSACVLKFPMWGTAFVTPHPSSFPLSKMQVSAENNMQRESLNTVSISNCYKIYFTG